VAFLGGAALDFELLDAEADGLAVAPGLANGNGGEGVAVGGLEVGNPKLNEDLGAASALAGALVPPARLLERVDVGAEEEEDAGVGLKGGSPPKEGSEDFVPFAAEPAVGSFGFVVGNLKENPPVTSLAATVEEVPLNGGMGGMFEGDGEPLAADGLNENPPESDGSDVEASVGPVDTFEDAG
jgi:hypothetical protein